jgi:hypothetical protein
MSQQELVNLMVAVLDELGIDYMVTGSVASSFQGEPRSTHDLDLVVAFPPEAVDRFVARFPEPEFHVSPASIREAIAKKFMFNLLSLSEGEKVDFWMLTDEPFDRSRFARKRVVDYGGRKIKVSAPEDTILAKLRWAQLSGGSQKQMTDALRIYELQHARLDHAYLEHWAAQLGIVSLWEQLKASANPK